MSSVSKSGRLTYKSGRVVKSFPRPLIIIIGLTPSQIPTHNGQCMSVYVCVRSRMASAPLRAPFSNYGRAFVHIRSCTS